MLGLWLSTKLIFGSQLLQIVVVREKRLVENESKNCLVVVLLVRLLKIKSKHLLERILYSYSRIIEMPFFLNNVIRNTHLHKLLLSQKRRRRLL